MRTGSAVRPVVSIRLDHLRRLTDDFGVIQFARGRDPDPASGYAADDVARALVVAARLGQEDLARIYLAFLGRALRADGWFHNLWSPFRRPLPAARSEDCQGRCLWALGEVVGSSLPHELREQAGRLVAAAAPTSAQLHGVRGRANALLGLAVAGLPEIVNSLADALHRQLDRAPDAWPWPEPVLTYELARVPHGLIRSADRVPAGALVLATALRTLDFLIDVMIEDGVVWPVGNRGWYPRGGTKARWDQQPVDPGALAEACAEAYRATGLERYREVARLAVQWFEGRNACRVPLVDEDGACRDGLSPHGVSENRGAESCLAYLLAALTAASLV
ncbi:MAG: glycosyl transferase [Armatimonadota bacterium]|nr:glycosyl transferase [Armatimonadota bacterium]MDR5698019.1 glycosyl transferase [Armatimonadota bacterium]